MDNRGRWGRGCLTYVARIVLLVGTPGRASRRPRVILLYSPVMNSPAEIVEFPLFSIARISNS